MMGPDFTGWHGFDEGAKHFYFELVPEVNALVPGLADRFLGGPEHARRKGLSAGRVKEALDFFRQRYGPATK